MCQPPSPMPSTTPPADASDRCRSPLNSCCEKRLTRRTIGASAALVLGIALHRAFNDLARSLQASRDRLRLLAEEQSALRRVATLVARGEPPAGVFAAVVTEVCRLLGADVATLFRFEPDDTATVVASHSDSGPVSAVGTRAAVEGESILVTVFRTGGAARLDGAVRHTGPLAAFA